MSVGCWILMSALAKLTLVGKESSVSGAAFSPPPTSPLPKECALQLTLLIAQHLLFRLV